MSRKKSDSEAPAVDSEEPTYEAEVTPETASNEAEPVTEITDIGSGKTVQVTLLAGKSIGGSGKIVAVAGHPGFSLMPADGRNFAMDKATGKILYCERGFHVQDDSVEVVDIAAFIEAAP